MSLWVRTQDRKHLFKINEHIGVTEEGYIITSNNNSMYNKQILLGDYKSEERAIEILNEIEKLMFEDIMENDTYEKIDLIIKAKILGAFRKIYVMPKE